jgi:uncharacterized protein (TIGR02118 family)
LGHFEARAPDRSQQLGIGVEMLKIVICIKRKPEMTREAFHAYWKDTHAKVVREVAGPLGIRRNVHNRTTATALDAGIRQSRGASQEDFDGVAESWFDSLEALIAATSTDEGRRAAKRLAEDEERFIDFSRSRIFFVDEEVVI